MQKTLNVFLGQNAMRDFLDPGKLPYLPLVEIPIELNPFYDDNVRIYAKLMNLLPLGNVKAIFAYNMISKKFHSGALEGIETIIENSSGNTVSSIALVARNFGIENTKSFVPHEISWHKLLMLLFFGVEPIVNVEPDFPSDTDPQSGIYKAKKWGEDEEMLNPGQYDNEDNPRAHEKWTAKQIWEQTEGKINVFCAGLGTTGTIIGNSRFLKQQKNSIEIVGAMRAPDNYVPGVRTEQLLKLIGFDWRPHTDDIQLVETGIAYKLSLELSRRGIIAGPSSGFALAGLQQFLKERKKSQTLEKLADRKTGKIVCVFPCPDGPFPYLDEYFKYLDAAEFPTVQNEEFLLNKP